MARGSLRPLTFRLTGAKVALAIPAYNNIKKVNKKCFITLAFVSLSVVTATKVMQI